MALQLVQDSNDVASPTGRRLALLICNGEFPLNPQWNIRGVAKDAEKISKVLASEELCDFEVSTVLNGGLVEVRREIAEICWQSTEHDTLLLYYSGQGTVNEEQRLILLVADSDPKHYLATGLEPNFILDQLRKAKCRSVILFIDTCYAGAFFTGNQGIPEGLYAITSCGANEMSGDTEEGGAFSLAIIEGLQGATADLDGDGRVTIEELHFYVQNQLKKSKVSINQIPQKWEWNVPNTIYMTTAQRVIFLSYSRIDSRSAVSIKTLLEADGFCVWMDTDGIHSGEWKERIFEGLKNARALLFLMTANSLESEWVKKEIDLASRKNIPIIPIRIGNPEIPDWFDFDYGALHRYDLDPENPEPTVKRLSDAIRDASTRTVSMSVKQLIDLENMNQPGDSQREATPTQNCLLTPDSNDGADRD